MNLSFIPTGDDLQAFVGERVYVKYWAHNKHLFLAHVPDKEGEVLTPANTQGTYDRDETRQTTSIYLPEEDVESAAYPGNLDQLCLNPNIRRVLLPIITRRTIDKFYEETLGKDFDDYIGEALKDIEIENPLFGRYLRAVSEESPKSGPVLNMGVSVYLVLRNEAKMPRITQDILNIELEDKEEEGHWSNLGDRLNHENPFVASLIHGYATHTDSMMVGYVGLSVYRLLEEQIRKNIIGGLKRELKRVISSEHFEDAARIRDRIKTY